MRGHLAIIVLSILPECIMIRVCPLVKHQNVMRRIQPSITLEDRRFRNLIAVVSFVVISREAGLRCDPSHSNIARAVLSVALVISSLRIGDLSVDPGLHTGDHGRSRNASTTTSNAALQIGRSGAVSRDRLAALGRA
jgi:hypothetical protein